MLIFTTQNSLIMLKYLRLIFVCFPLFIFSQVHEVEPPDFIKTINFRSNTPETQLPILKIGAYLVLEFDVLNGEEADYYYKIEHYDFDWKPSVLMKSEYLQGFDNQRIRDYENSFNTYQIYSHYKLTIPNQFTKGLLVSGNYMISIYNDDDDLVFSRKFMVYEDIVDVGVSIKRARDVQYVEEKQRVELVVQSSRVTLNNPMQTVRVVMIQNNNLKNAISNIKPQYTIGNQLIYKYDSETSFWGGNEYFYFENKDIRAANTGIQFIDLQEIYHNYLYTNRERSNQPYTFNPDINGNYVVLNLGTTYPSIEADYVWVHFSLKASDAMIGKKIHVFGNFNNFSLDDTTRMDYHPERGVFESRMRLKQGFYNYKFVVADAQKSVDEGFVSGNFYQTENNYKVLVYYRDLGARYDKIIGVGEGSSINITN